MTNPAPGFAKNPEHRVDIEPSPRRVRVTVADRVVADTTHAMLLRESRHTPVYYIPRTDVALDMLTKTEHSTYCPYKGHASYYTITAGNRVEENAIWSYETPYDECDPIREHMAFYWKKVDHWYEEDEEIFVHPRDPHKRVDVVLSHRPVRVVLGGETVAETTNARFLFETGLPTRYYIPAADVRMELLARSQTQTACPYKGEAVYWSAKVGGQLFEDIVWSYPEPIAEQPKIKGLLSFFNEKVDAIFVDGVEQERPVTKWSKS